MTSPSRQAALGRLLIDLCSCAEQAAIWYAGDSLDLPVVTTIEELHSQVAAQLPAPMNEVYLQFRATNQEPQQSFL